MAGICDHCFILDTVVRCRSQWVSQLSDENKASKLKLMTANDRIVELEEKIHALEESYTRDQKYIAFIKTHISKIDEDERRKINLDQWMNEQNKTNEEIIEGLLKEKQDQFDRFSLLVEDLTKSNVALTSSNAMLKKNMSNYLKQESAIRDHYMGLIRRQSLIQEGKIQHIKEDITREVGEEVRRSYQNQTQLLQHQLNVSTNVAKSLTRQLRVYSTEMNLARNERQKAITQYQQRCHELSLQIEKEKQKYKQLEDRRNAEVEGYLRDLQNARKQLSLLEARKDTPFRAIKKGSL